MFLDRAFPYRTSFGIHTVVGLTIGITLSFILIVLGPFGTDTFQHELKFALLAGYGLIMFVLYLLAHSVENSIFLKDKEWNWGREITFQILFGIAGILFAYLYQELVINERAYSLTNFIAFLFYIALPLFPLLVIPAVLLRFFLINNSNTSYTNVISKQNIEYIQLNGENNTDVFIVNRKSLLYVKSIDNYVQIYYLEKENIETRILRSTLSSIAEQVDFLFQPHRSYLVNLNQDLKLKGNSQKAQLHMQGSEDVIPVARSTYRQLKNRLQSIPKG